MIGTFYLQNHIFFLTAASMERVRCVHTNLEDDGEALREDFKTYLGDLLAAMSDKRDSEELSILNS